LLPSSSPSSPSSAETTGLSPSDADAAAAWVSSLWRRWDHWALPRWAQD
jgi:hypothetical protein